MSELKVMAITSLPQAESERYEFKSSQTPFGELKTKLGRAASGFWNSGGGVFIAGVDGSGCPDGGIPTVVGRQPLRDWVDRVLQEVSPTGLYDIRLFEPDPASGVNISTAHCVLGVEFLESRLAPHIAPDHRYYIRAGAHTEPASHFIVEALFARRRYSTPNLVHTFRLRPEYQETVQLGLVALTDEPAVNISVDIHPLPDLWEGSESLPIVLPVIDRSHPFYLDLTTFHMGQERLGADRRLKVNYHDLAGKAYKYEAALDVTKSMSPWKIGQDNLTKIAKSLEKIAKSCK